MSTVVFTLASRLWHLRKDEDHLNMWFDDFIRDSPIGLPEILHKTGGRLGSTEKGKC
jgi:hypothetical protein